MALTKGPKGGELEYKAGKQSDPQVVNQVSLFGRGMLTTSLADCRIGPNHSKFHASRPGWDDRVLSFVQLSQHGQGGLEVNWGVGQVWCEEKSRSYLKRSKVEVLMISAQVFFEPEDNTAVESTLQEYTAAVQCENKPKGGGGGALLFAVIGAKLSEGLNFKDELARAVVIVGMPFANLGSPELKERLKYVKRLEENGKANGTRVIGKGKDAAAELYENMCMNAVNQSIGV